MKPILLMLLLSTPAVALDERAALAAIAQRETHNRDVVGRAGEVTRYQLSPATVRQHGTKDPRVHLRWLQEQFRRRGVDWNIFNVALAWNAGLEGATTGRAPLSSYTYAREVQNIYWQITSKK